MEFSTLMLVIFVGGLAAAIGAVIKLRFDPNTRIWAALVTILMALFLMYAAGRLLEVL